MTSKKPAHDDLHDRLLDLALRETLGSEVPPDLAQQILTAANEQPSQQSTLAKGDEAMHGNHDKARKTRKIWLSLTVAASLLIAAGLTFSGEFWQTSKKLAKTQEPATATNNGDEVKTNDTMISELQEPEATSFGATVSAPKLGESLLLGSIEGLPKSKNKDELMMAVTPHIIIQDEEAGRLGIMENDGESPARPAIASSKPASGNKLPPAFYSMGRAKKKDLKTNGLTAARPPVIFPDAKEKQYLKRRRARYAQVDLGTSLSTLTPDVVTGNSSAPSQSGFAMEIQETLAWKFRNPGENGEGPGTSGDQYTRIYENPFITAKGDAAVSTFSIDVDTASYANVRQFLMQANRMPPPDAVRLEELVNYFDYDYTAPTDDTPFAAHVEVAGCPWHAEHRLVRIGIKGREIETKNRPQSNLVFLIDVSGSMNDPAKLPLLVEGLKMLTRQLSENDRVAIVVYASSEGLALDSTRGDQQDTILAALNNLRAGGSTAGGAGIQLAYQIAEDHFIQGGTNRVILATDGDFNVGTTSTAELERMAESKAKETGVFLTVLGFGRGNLNDAMMEAISGKGNGNYHYIDNQTEARKVLVEEMTGTLLTIAKDVKIQIEFNPAQVAGYRLLGYENRMLRTEDFNDDKKDAGEIGAGHTVTALYEIVPAGKSVDATKIDSLKYQQPTKTEPDATVSGPVSDDLLTLKIRYKLPESDTSTKLEFPITDADQPFSEATSDFKFAAAVASFGMQLRNSEHQGNATLDAVLEIAESGISRDPHGYRAEFKQLVRKAKQLRGNE